MDLELICPYCESDRVHTVTDSETKEDNYYCFDCEMEWGNFEQARQEIKEARA
jgi:hypothetical protein